MKKLILSIAISGCMFYSAKAQTTVFVDESGDYVQMLSPKLTDTTKLVKTGKFLKTKSGDRLPVYTSKNGKEFVLMTSKKGNVYRRYLALFVEPKN
jgi:hypothetical protein